VCVGGRGGEDMGMGMLPEKDRKAAHFGTLRVQKFAFLFIFLASQNEEAGMELRILELSELSLDA
jgi:hypothetical protein